MILDWTSQTNRNIDRAGRGVNKVYGGGIQSIADRFTDDFVTAATANFRCPKAMLEVTWADSDVDQNFTVESNDINRINRTGQLFNGKTESGQKWAYIHSGLLADGTFHAAPDLDSDLQMGWYGTDNVSDGSGNFSTSPYLQLNHVARAYSAILVAGDSEYNEYPVDFTLTFTHSGGPTNIVVTGNTERVYSSAISFISNVTAVRITVSKWSAPNTVVKITQFSGSLIELYKSDDIVELNILEETNSDTGIVPIGNVSSNELDITLLNTDRRFSYGNTDSPYNASLLSGRKLRVWLGFTLPVGSTDATGDVDGYIVETVSGEKIGYMPYGIFWSKDWLSSYDSQVTTTTAYDITYRLSQKEFLKSDNYAGTIQSVVDDVLTEAKNEIPELTWRVSDDTSGIVLGNIAFEPKNYLDILKDITEAVLGFTYVDRNGVLVVGSRLEASPTLETWQEVDMSGYYNYKSNPKFDELINRVRVGYTKYEIPVVGIYSKDREYTIPASGSLTFSVEWSPTPVDVNSITLLLEPVIGAAEITAQAIYSTGANITVSGDEDDTFTLNATGTPSGIYSSDDTFTIPASGQLEMYIAWSNAPVLISSVNVALTLLSGDPTITQIEKYAYGANLIITGTVGSTFNLSATGTPYELKEDTETAAEDDNSIKIYGVREFALTGNQLITHQDLAQELADALILRYGDLRHDGEMSWPSSTLVSVGDSLEVVEFKSDTVETKGTFIIKRQNIKFAGYMQGNVELRRG